MTLLTAADAARLPALYATDHVPLADKVAQVKFFAPWTNWDLARPSSMVRTERLAWGWVIGHEQELGYFSLDEMEAIRETAACASSAICISDRRPRRHAGVHL